MIFWCFVVRVVFKDGKIEEHSFIRERDACTFFGELKDREDVISVSYYIK